MKLSAEHRAILDLVVEDSYALSEIIWRLRGAHPELPPPELQRLAKKSITELLDVGLVELTQLDEKLGEETALDTQSASRAIENDLNWLEPRDTGPQVRVVATESGEAAYYNRA